jgi:hypothetical protein
MKLNHLLLCAVAAIAALILAAQSAATGARWTATLVAAGLDNPRGIAVAASGTVYVAEGGHGGDVCSPVTRCIGTTSQISQIDPKTGAHRAVVTGLYSRGVANEGITGVDGLTARGGRLEATITSYPEELDGWTCAGGPADCATVLKAARAQAGQLISFTPSGSWKPIAGVGSSDLAWAAAHPGFSREPANGNPYGVFALPGATLVTDAGANTLGLVTANGRVATLSAFAPPAADGFPADTVPTCVTVVRGNIYVGSLSGQLFKRAGSFSPSEVQVGSGFLHHVTGCTSDAGGDVFVVDMWGTPGPPIPVGPGSAAGTGSVVELARDGTASVLASGLMFPNAIALAKDGSLYVTVGSTCTAQGSPFPYCAAGGGVVRIHQ